MSKSTESMFDGKDVLIPLAEVSYILKFPSCIEVHFKGSAESVTLVQPDQNALISAWCRYRGEVEADTLMDLDGAQPAPSMASAMEDDDLPRAHHATWCADVTHPDMRLMAAAPDLLESLKALLERYVLAIGNEGIECLKARAAIAKATGDPQ